MNNLDDLSHKLLDEQLTETEMGVRLLWFLLETGSEQSVSTQDIVDILETTGLRHNVNRSRLYKNLARRKGVSGASGVLKLSLAVRKEFESKYGEFLEKKPPVVHDSVLELSDFSSSRGYVSSLAKQINGTFQFGYYDACAVMMRRLMEVLIIDAYETHSLRGKILHDGEYMQLSGLIGVIASKQDFKLSRNALKWMHTCKELGDNAAHSRTYVTKLIDIDDFKIKYRNLISELSALQ